MRSRSRRARRASRTRHRGARAIRRLERGQLPARLLVRLDPGRRHAGVAQHPVGHRPVARPPQSSSSGSRSPWYGRSSNAPPSIASRIWRSTRLSQLGADLRRPSASRRCTLMTGSYRDRDRRADTVRCYGWGRMDRIDGRARLFRHGPRRLPRLRAPDPARTRGAGRPRPAADARRPGARRHPQARVPARSAVPRGPARRGPERRRDRARRSVADRGEELRAAAARRSMRWPPAPTSSTRRRSSTARSAATPTSCSGSTSPDRPSRWGPYHYEVADTKLARHVKASAVLQICSYVDQLERIQGVRPEWLHVALGGSARTVERLRVDDYMAYYRSARDRFLATLADETPPTYPPRGDLPRARRALRCLPLGGRMREAASRRRPPEPRRRHLGAGSAGAGRRGVATLEALGELALPMEPPLEGVGEGALSASTSRRGSSSRVGAKAPASTSSLPAPARRSSSIADWHRCRRRRRATCSSTSRAIRTRRRRARLPVRRPRHRRRRSTRSGRATPPASSRSTASGGPSSG